MSRMFVNMTFLLIVGLLVSVCPSGAQSEAGKLLSNQRFEKPEGREGAVPEGWFVFSGRRADIGVVLGRGVEGAQCLKMGSVGLPRSFQGIAQTVQVEAGSCYTWSALVINNRSDPLQGTAFGQLVIEWKDEQGAEIDRTWGGTWNNNLSKLRWEKVTIERIEAPKNAAYAVVGIHLYEGDNGGKGSFFVDSVSFVPE